MIIELKGRFTKETFLEQIKNQLDMHIEDTVSLNGRICIRQFDEDGDAIEGEQIDEFEHIVEVYGAVECEPLTNPDIMAIVTLMEEDKSVDEIAAHTTFSTARIEKMIEKIKEVNLSSSKPLFSKEAMREYMMSESEVHTENPLNLDYMEWAGACRTSGTDLEKAYSVETYCTKHDLTFVKRLGSYSKYVTKRELFDQNCAHLLKGATPDTLMLYNKEIHLAYNLQKLTENQRYLYFENGRLPESYTTNMSELPKPQLAGLEIGYKMDFSGLSPVYSREKVYKALHITIVSDEELDKAKGKTLFSEKAVHNYFPSSYKVKDLLTPYGYGLDGLLYLKPKEPLYEHFGFIPSSDVQEGDFQMSPRHYKRTKNFLEKHDMKLDTIFPDGMTENFLLVYRKGKIPADVVEAYEKSLYRNFLRA